MVDDGEGNGWRWSGSLDRFGSDEDHVDVVTRKRREDPPGKLTTSALRTETRKFSSSSPTPTPSPTFPPSDALTEEEAARIRLPPSPWEDISPTPVEDDMREQGHEAALAEALAPTSDEIIAAARRRLTPPIRRHSRRSMSPVGFTSSPAAPATTIPATPIQSRWLPLSIVSDSPPKQNGDGDTSSGPIVSSSATSARRRRSRRGRYRTPASPAPTSTFISPPSTTLTSPPLRHTTSPYSASLHDTRHHDSPELVQAVAQDAAMLSRRVIFLEQEVARLRAENASYREVLGKRRRRRASQ